MANVQFCQVIVGRLYLFELAFHTAIVEYIMYYSDMHNYTKLAFNSLKMNTK